jgi:hypothetical protein
MCLSVRGYERNSTIFSAHIQTLTPVVDWPLRSPEQPVALLYLR